MDKKTYKKALKQMKINNRHKMLSVVLIFALFSCLSKISHLDDKLRILIEKNDNGVAKNKKGE